MNNSMTVQHAFCLEAIVVSKALIAPFFCLFSVFVPAAAQGGPVGGAGIAYVSADLKFAAVFSTKAARFGDLSALAPGAWPTVPVRTIHQPRGLSCISVGPLGNTIEFAVKRPFRSGDKYQCLKTVFRVTECFQYCKAAIVEVERPFGGNVRGKRKTYLYIDDCLGLVASSEVRSFSSGIPLDALWLRGPVGILADPSYPKCKSY
jgi:hypothetical protein